jgi:hypothetical protein
MQTTQATPKITSGRYAHGSYGFDANPPGTTMTLWRCGVHVHDGKLYSRGPGYIGNTSAPCMHRTREEARECPNRAEYLRNGEGAAARTGQR